MLTGVTPNANVEVYINLDCMPYIKDNAPPFNMIALLLYTDAILTRKQKKRTHLSINTTKQQQPWPDKAHPTALLRPRAVAALP